MNQFADISALVLTIEKGAYVFREVLIHQVGLEHDCEILAGIVAPTVGECGQLLEVLELYWAELLASDVITGTITETPTGERELF